MFVAYKETGNKINVWLSSHIVIKELKKKHYNDFFVMKMKIDINV